MYSFTPTITPDDHLLIVGYYDADKNGDRSTYNIPIATITASNDQQCNSKKPSTWTKLTNADHWNTALVPNSSPPVVVGGREHSNQGATSTVEIKMYDNSNKSWKKIGSLSSARSYVAVAAVYSNAIIIIGGCTKGGSLADAESSSVTVVELGQVELLH